MNKLRETTLHPFLLGVYVVLGLLIPNFEQVGTKVVFRSLVVISAGMVLLILLMYFLFRSWIKAAILSTLVGILFFSYGHVYSALKAISIFDILVFRHRTLLPIWGILFIGSVVLIQKLRSIRTFNSYLNLFFGLLVGLSIIQVLLLFIESADSNVGVSAQAQSVSSGQFDQPDIYYIVLDSYGREDILRDLMEYDNSAFISELEHLGFYVADCSQSNYAQTQLSLGSSLNFNYLDVLAAEGDVDAVEALNTSSLIKHSQLRYFLEAQGYVTVAFATGFNFTQITDADQFLTPKPGRQQLNEFEYLLLQTSLVRAILDFQLVGVEDVTSDRFRERTLFTLDKLDTLYQDPRPKFIFAHIIAPHPPFVLGPSGEFVSKGFTREHEFSPEDYIDGYTGQTTYVNGVITESIRTIIEKSERPVLILLQGDHGPGRFTPESRMGILNAYYFPDRNYSHLYKSISPVNSFRIILDLYFAQELPLLEDVSWYSAYQKPYDYHLIENTCKK